MEAENLSLKAEVTHLKEENEQAKGRLDQLAGQMASLENNLSLRIHPHEVEGMMLARLWEGINISQRIVQLVDPNFSVELINLSNLPAQCRDSLVVEPQERQGPPPLP
ncbi:hypothetical protein Nepgr_019253 [Nepenthes gracilis]|uniref:Uncharacterized protein n=1 Tax=Nepenthes gracilis TaxID=150966 RepID=A0AAD3XTV9_NEPGR|nr:hypothetical protein Nepgr_019253 [Nepenthes gracilis]